MMISTVTKRSRRGKLGVERGEVGLCKVIEGAGQAHLSLPR